MRLDLFGQHGDYFTVLQLPYETFSRNAITLLDKLTIDRGEASGDPLIHQQRKFNKNLFEKRLHISWERVY